MSNKAQLQTNNTALDALITRVNAAKDAAASLPEAGGGSGGESFDNCTIVFQCDYNYWGCNGTFIEDGQYKIIWEDTGYGIHELPCTLQAQCGSILYISIPGFYSASITAGELIYAESGVGIAFKVPDTPTQCLINAITE